jgi:AcrR family transcriptional regulator
MGQKLTREDRRQQLLATAKAIAREEGVDALTLGRLAERSGVSKPVTYDHFGTREGLLIELYRGIDEAQVQALRTALSRGATKLDEVAQAIGECYMNCSLMLGGEWHAIAAALQGSEAMEKVQRELIDKYVALYAKALAPFTSLRGEDLRLRCVGIHGAAESIAREVSLGRAGQARATATLQALILGSLEPNVTTRSTRAKSAKTQR